MKRRGASAQQPWGKDMVLVALTGWGQTEDRRRSKEAGFNHHLVKPADPAVVAKLISSLPSLRHLAVELDRDELPGSADARWRGRRRRHRSAAG